MDQNEVFADTQSISSSSGMYPAAYGYPGYPNVSDYGMRQAYPSYGGYGYGPDAARDTISGMDPMAYRDPVFFGRRPFFFGFPFIRPFFNPFFSPFFPFFFI